MNNLNLLSLNNKMSKILVTGSSIRSELLQPLVDSGYIVENPTHLLTEAELGEALKSSVAYLLGGDEYASREAISHAKHLKVISFLGMGYQSFIDVDATREFDIPVTNTPGTLSNSVAEFTIGLLLSSTRKLFSYASLYEKGLFGNEVKQHDLSSMHIGIIGLGGIGTRIVEILRFGFGTKVSYYSRTRKTNEETRLGISYNTLNNLLLDVDALIVMIPGTPESKNLIGKPEISKLKKGTILINTARAEIIDPAALLEGLNTEKISYAAFDGFYEDQPELIQQLEAFIPEKLMVTGHIASLTHEARDGMARMATQSIINILSTGEDSNIANRDKSY